MESAKMVGKARQMAFSMPVVRDNYLSRLMITRGTPARHNQKLSFRKLQVLRLVVGQRIHIQSVQPERSELPHHCDEFIKVDMLKTYTLDRVHRCPACPVFAVKSYSQHQE